ncbi:MAG: glycine--tRNA ligase subunit beta [Deltaproteobacteria bacterium]|nr:MAG: glycine--tRNA ligase subunit beta [Deltaproteobacteria bacterium]
MNLVVEIGCEEIPPSDVKISKKFLSTFVPKEIQLNALCFQKIDIYTTTRRIIILIQNITRQNSYNTFTGPVITASFNASFSLSSIGFSFFSNKQLPLEQSFISRAHQSFLSGYLFFYLNPIENTLISIILKSLSKIPFNSSMFWNESKIKFVRPIIWIACLLNNKILPFKFANILSSNFSRGHRLLSSNPRQIKESNYLSFLNENHILIKSEERKSRILSRSKKLSRSVNGKLSRNKKLENILSNLSESPWPILGSFHKKYLKIPHEILSYEIELKQKCLKIVSKSNHLLPFFLIISSLKPQNTKKIIIGYENILQARFQDGLFYFQEDILNNFLITSSDSSLQAIALKISKEFSYHKLNLLTHACILCKADLKTFIIDEFPELQGIIGGIYSKYLKIHYAISNAIYEHYLPKFINDEFPKTKLGIILSLADKLQVLYKFPIPKTNIDPFGVRKSTINFIKILLYYYVPINLKDILEEDILYFFLLRIKHLLAEKYPILLTENFFHTQNNNISNAFLVIQLTLRSNLSSLTAIYKRIKNILQQSILTSPTTLNYTTLIEKKIFIILHKISNEKQYDKKILLLITLKPYIDLFFNTTIILAQNTFIQRTRLSLLMNVYNEINNIIHPHILK